MRRVGSNRDVSATTTYGSQVSSTLPTSWKYCQAEAGKPPPQPSPQVMQHASTSFALTSTSTFWWMQKRSLRASTAPNAQQEPQWP